MADKKPKGLLGLSGARPDMTQQYNSPYPSSPALQAAYLRWLGGRVLDLKDYDMRGAFYDNAQRGDNGHLTDVGKKPNHPTFSTESKYNGVDGFFGGQWVDLGNNRWAFQASQTNVDMMSPRGLLDYFRRVEPGNELRLPKKK